MKTILIIKAGQKIKSIPVEEGDFEDWLISGMNLAVENFTVINVFRGQALPLLENVCGIVITGSPAMVTDLEEWSECTSTYLRQAVEQQIPVLGVCYGHQLLAHALGGKVDFHPEGREIGTTTVTLTQAGLTDPLFSNLPERFLVNVSHSQSVIKLPAHASILGANDFEPHHAIRYAEKAWGVQFHPEFNALTMRTYLVERRQDLEKEGLNVEKLLAEVCQTPESESLLLNFANIFLSEIPEGQSRCKTSYKQ